MKSKIVLCLMCIACVFLPACQSEDDKENANGTLAKNMVWFPKSATVTGKEVKDGVRIETALEDKRLEYKCIFYGETSMGGTYEKMMGFEMTFDNGKVNGFYELSKYASEVEKSELVLEYDEAGDCYIEKEVNTKDGSYSGYDRYEYTFDDEGRVLTRKSTYIERNKKDEEWVETPYDTHLYTYEYSGNGYYITRDYQPYTYTLASGEEAECIRRRKQFIPYDADGKYTEQYTFHLLDGTQVCVNGDNSSQTLYEDNTKMTEFIYNNKGYLIEIKAYLGDGNVKTVQPKEKSEVKYNDKNDVVNYVEYVDNKEYNKGVFTYDENGNITHVDMIIEGVAYEADIEWMQIPDYLAANKMFPYGDGYFAISEIIEDVIPEKFFTERENYVYTKNDLKEISDALK